MTVRITPAAQAQIDEIFAYGLEAWGVVRATRYSNALFDFFERILSRDIIWRSVPGTFARNGYFARYESHLIYWRSMALDSITIVAILHVRMDQRGRLRDAFRNI